MDVLIELIVWLFRAIFGEPDKSEEKRDITRPRPTHGSNRGPYQYGDEGKSRPKTLEEILEEVRREAAQKKGAATAPPPAPVAERPERRTLESTLAPADETGIEPIKPVTEMARIEAPPPPPAAPPSPTFPNLRPATYDTHPPAKRRTPQPSPQSPAPKPAREAPSKRRETEKEAARQAARAAADAAGPATLPLELMRTLRQAAPEAKRAAARQAIVMMEVLGPPRSRRPVGSSPRSF